MTFMQRKNRDAMIFLLNMYTLLAFFSSKIEIVE